MAEFTNGIGPGLEARDVLQVLRGDPRAPADLRERALLIAGGVLDLIPGATPGQGLRLARALLDSGRAWHKFQAICLAQGGFTEPEIAPYRCTVLATRPGTLLAIDNRRLARIAKLAGAPAALAAGVDCYRRVGDRVDVGEPLFEVHAQSAGELDYAVDYSSAHRDIFSWEDEA